MGFDLYGLSPRGNNPKPILKNYPEEKKDEFFKEFGDWVKNTRGSYFRASIWGWSKIWGLVGKFCSDIVDEETFDNGYSNDATRISSQQALGIASRLSEAVKDGRISELRKKDEEEFKNNTEMSQMLRYPFPSEEYLNEFIEFNQNSGGYEIC